MAVLINGNGAFCRATKINNNNNEYSPLSFSCSLHHRFQSQSNSNSNSKSKSLVSWRRNPKSKPRANLICSSSSSALLKVVISGPPGSGKGTLCHLIANKFGMVHISTGDLLSAEVSSRTEIGNKAKVYIDSGSLVPDEIVTAMVKARLSQEDAKEKGWLLDGYPRSSSQAQALERINLRPDILIELDVPDETLIERCIGRRLDPVTGKIYHVKNFPPETEEIWGRLVTRSDDTEEKVKSRLETHKKSVEAISSTYLDILKKVDGNRLEKVVFEEVASLLLQAQKAKQKISSPGKAEVFNIPKVSSTSEDNWRGIPTRLNNIPHTKEIRNYFYDDVLSATKRAVEDGKTLLKVEINIPELNPEMDVYRIGTLMELARVLSLSFAECGKQVKVCVQGSMGEGALAGIPLQLAGTRKILEFMDWGNSDAMGTSIRIGSIGAKEVDEKDDVFILIAPQNAVGNCIIDDLKGMTDAAGNRPVVLINPRLKDLPASSGIMQTMGRDKRLEYAASFQNCYFFRLLYYAGSQYPIMGALRMSYPYRYELYKRVNEASGKEKYVILATFPEKPSVDEINDAFDGKPRNQGKRKSGIWELMMDMFS